MTPFAPPARVVLPARAVLLAWVAATSLPATLGAQSAAAAGDRQAVQLGGEGERPAGWLGIRINAGTRVLDDSIVVIVADVYPGGPAAEGGVLPGDRVLAVDGATFVGWEMWNRLTADILPGRALRLSLLGGDGAVREETVVAGNPPSSVVSDAPNRLVSDQRARDELVAIQLRLLRTMDSLLRVSAFPSGQVEQPWSRARSFDLLAGALRGARRGDSLAQAAIRRTQEQRLSSREAVRTADDDYATPADGGGGPVLRPVRSEASWQVRLMTPALLDNPFLFGGALARNLTGELGRYFDSAAGVLLTDVLARTSAAAAGFQPGDVIVAVADQETPTLAALRTALAGTRPPYQISVVRRGGRTTVWYPQAPGQPRR